jgi:hypothetical protein
VLTSDIICDRAVFKEEKKMRYQIDRYDKLPRVIWERRDLILLFLAGLMFGFALAAGIGICLHERYLEARVHAGLMWRNGKQYSITEIQPNPYKPKKGVKWFIAPEI